MESETDKERIEPAATERKQRLEGEKKGKKTNMKEKICSIGNL